MKGTTISLVMAIGMGFTACTNQNSTDSQIKEGDTTTNNTAQSMSAISIVEIPTSDFARAIAFYQAILDIKIEEAEMEGIKIGLFPNAGEGVFVQLINGTGYRPSPDGTVVYLNANDDLQVVADKVVANGGEILVPKTSMGPEMGFFAIFLDTEGNKLGLHSYR